MKLSVLGTAKMQTRKVSPILGPSSPGRLCISACWKWLLLRRRWWLARRRDDWYSSSTAVVLYRKACLVPKSIAPKAFLHWDSLKCRAGTIPNFSSFHHIEMVTYPMILYDIICMIIRLSAWYPNCKLLDYPSLSKTCSRLGSLSLSRQVPWITTVVYHPLEAADGGDGLEIRGSQRIDMPYLPSGNLT